jgi:hypothetical protein
VIICVAEDRPDFESAIRLLLMSLARHCGELPIYLIFPPANPTFVAWVNGDRRITLSTDRLEGTSTYNLKPQAMLHLMARGYDEIVWVDSDVIVTNSVASSLVGLAPDAMVVTEEALWSPHDDDDAWRARRWGLEVGRVLPFTLNSAVVRVTRFHRPLLQRWRELLECQEYRHAQTLDWRVRPLHLISDQDALTALLTSEFATVPLKTLMRGHDIIQYFGPYGFTVRERLFMLSGRTPTFIHSQGPRKPWNIVWESGARTSLKEYLHKIYLDLSPYTLAAIQYRSAIPTDTAWMNPHYFLSKVLRAIGLWRLSLVGLPIAILSDIYRLTKPLQRLGGSRAHDRENMGGFDRSPEKLQTE